MQPRLLLVLEGRHFSIGLQSVAGYPVAMTKSDLIWKVAGIRDAGWVLV